MALTGNRLAMSTALAAVFSIVTTPVLAAGIPFPQPVHAAVPAADTADHRRRHHGNGVDAGDIIAGVLVLGGIAAIASAAGNADRRDRDYREYPDPRPYPDGSSYRTPAEPYRAGGQSGGMDRAVDICVAEVERSASVGTVDNATRGGDGWFVSGETGNGAPWTCRIGNDGRISDIDVGDAYGLRDDGYPPASQGQYDDETYARARAQLGTRQPGY